MGTSLRIALVLTSFLSVVMVLNATNLASRYSSKSGGLRKQYVRHFKSRLSWIYRGYTIRICGRGFKPGLCFMPKSGARKRTTPSSFSGSIACRNEKCVHGSCGNESCQCDRGWKGRRCDVDVDECRTIFPPCQQYCSNTPGSFRCICGVGYRLYGDGRSCVRISIRKWMNDFDERKSDTMLYVRLSYQRGSWRPISTRGSKSNAAIRPQKEELLAASPTEKYSRRRETLPAKQYSLVSCKKECSYKCIRQEEEEECLCPKGFSLGSNEKSCIDRNECLDASSFQCPTNKECRNTVGSFACVCRSGYSVNNRTHTKGCDDVNECLTGEHKCGKDSICHNTIGSYACNCRPGYLKAGDACIQQNPTEIDSSGNGRESRFTFRSRKPSQLPIFDPDLE